MSKRQKQKSRTRSRDANSIEKKESTVKIENIAEQKEIDTEEQKLTEEQEKEAEKLTEEQEKELIQKIIESSNKEYESFGNGGVSKDTKHMIIAICIIVLIVFVAATVLKANKTNETFKDTNTITAEFDGEAVHLDERTGD